MRKLVLSLEPKLRKREQTTPEPIRITVLELGLDIAMRLFPDRHCRGQQSLSLRCQEEAPAAAIETIWRDFDQAATLQRLECRGQRGAIHGKEIGHCRDRRRLRPVQRHHERELAVRQLERPQGLIEAAGQGARRPLHVKT